MPTDILIIGAGGHAKVVIEACNLSNPNTQIAVVDQSPDKVGIFLLGRYQVDLLDTSKKLPSHFHVAIGSNSAREILCKLNLAMNSSLIPIVHPCAILSPSAVIGAGSFIAAGSVVSSDAVIHEGCIINHGSVIDHDCHIGRFTHVAPNATVCGGVHIGEGCLIGAGAIILPMVSIGRNAVIGAGAVIKADVPAYKTVVGVPGKQI